MNRKYDSRPRKTRGERGRSERGPRAEPGSPREREKGDSFGPPKKLSPGKLRIIGGEFRGRTIRYHGAEFTRPMKDSVRENLFNILGDAIRGTIAFDLFSGTGAVAIESLSRGAGTAVAVEQSRMAAQYIREASEKFGIERRLRVITGNAFRLAPKLLSHPIDDTPWAVFLCPPYRMWEDETDFASLKSIIEGVLNDAPPGSLLIAETEKRFDPARLPAGNWDLREYGDTRLAIIEPEARCGLRL